MSVTRRECIVMDQRDRNLLIAFGMLGAILGLGGFGLGKALAMFAAAAGWFSSEINLGPFYAWVGAGGVLGGVLAWLLVTWRRR
jgi:hypothetical protein